MKSNVWAPVILEFLSLLALRNFFRSAAALGQLHDLLILFLMLNHLVAMAIDKDHVWVLLVLDHVLIPSDQTSLDGASHMERLVAPREITGYEDTYSTVTKDALLLEVLSVQRTKDDPGLPRVEINLRLILTLILRGAGLCHFFKVNFFDPINTGHMCPLLSDMLVLILDLD
jgi:hypothetical protein